MDTLAFIGRLIDWLRFDHMMNYYEVGEWLINKGHVEDMEAYERKCQMLDAWSCR